MNNLLQKIFDEGYVPAVDDAREWMDEYPACVVPLAALLKEGRGFADDEETRALVARLAASYADRNDFCDVVGEDAARFVGFYPSETVATPTTEATIDSFLERFGNPNPAETAALTKMIFNPAPDYASVLAAEEQRSVPTADELDAGRVDETTLRINRFIAASKGEPTPASQPAQPENKPVSVAAEPAAAETPAPRRAEPSSASLSEGLATLMIKNGNYRKALEIITALSLNNPEKSAYFADQIRFLRKLIIIDSKKQ